MKTSKLSTIMSATLVAIAVITLIGCGKKDENQPNPAPAPVPTTPVPTTPTTTTPVPVPVANPACGFTPPSGSVALFGNPYTANLTSNYGGYYSNNRISMTLYSLSSYANPYSQQYIAGIAQLTLPELSQYPYQNQNTSFCVSTSTTQPGNFMPSSGQVQLVLQGNNNFVSSPYYPAQNLLVTVYVGYDCPAYLVPSYSSTGAKLQGCVRVAVPNSYPGVYQFIAQ